MKKEANLKNAVYNAILEDIFSLEYRPGQILNEKAIVEKYSCSKSPVRDALQALCADNVLRSIPRYGYEVIRLTMEDVYEMIQFRYLLEGGLLRSQGGRLTPAHLARLDEIDKKCSLYTDDARQHWAYNTEFHLRLIAFCGNSYAARELERCMNRLKRAYSQLYYGVWEQDSSPLDTRYHAAILACLREGDAEGAVRHLADDLNDFGAPGRNWPFAPIP